MEDTTAQGVKNSAFNETDVDVVERDLEATQPTDPGKNEETKLNEDLWDEDLDDFQVNLIEDYESVPKEDRNFIYILYRPVIWCAKKSTIIEWCFYVALVIGIRQKYTRNLNLIGIKCYI